MFKQKQVQLPNSPTKHSVDYQAQPIREEDRTISGSALRTSLEKSRTTYSDMERETKEIAERQERKRLLFLQKSGANMTNEQINRLHTLNTLYQTTPENNIPIR